MKTKTLILITSLLAGGFTLRAIAETNTHTIVAVAPWLPPEQRDGIARLTANLLIESPAGSKFTVLDVSTLNTVVHVTVGDGSKRLRQQRLAPQIVSVVAAIRAATNFGACFNVPVVLDHAGRELRQRGVKTTVVLVGPALYQNPKEPAFDMTTAWPTDGHVKAGINRSVFSTLERAHHLDDVTVAWLVTDAQALRNESHRQGVSRFWVPYVGSQGGKLVSYSPDARSVFGRVFEERPELVTVVAPEPEDGQVVMLSHTIVRAQPIVVTNPPIASVPESLNVARTPAPTVSVPIAPPVTNSPVASLPSTPAIPTPVAPTTNAPAALPTVAAGDTGIGIVWQAEPGHSSLVDLDLYVQPPNGGPELFYGSTNSPQGHYYRDVRQSIQTAGQNWQSLWEFAELRGDQLPEFVWVNLYSGRGPVRGELRVHYHGRMMSSPFVINAREGNKGGGKDQRRSNPAWVRLELSTLSNTEPPR